MTEKEILIHARNLSYDYNRVRPGVTNINLDIPGGQVVGLLGPNGSGKTTLLKLLAGQLMKYSGELCIGGQPIGPETKAMTAFLPDRSFFSNWMKLDDIIGFYETFFPDFDKIKAIDFLRAMRLDPGRSVREMSLGERERVAVAMTMSRRVRLYLLDEPIGAVDPSMRDVIFRTIITDIPEDALVLFSSHLIAEAEAYMDTVILMKFGSVFLTEEAEKLRARLGMSVDQYFREVFLWS